VRLVHPGDGADVESGLMSIGQQNSFIRGDGRHRLVSGIVEGLHALADSALLDGVRRILLRNGPLRDADLLLWVGWISVVLLLGTLDSGSVMEVRPGEVHMLQPAGGPREACGDELDSTARQGSFPLRRAQL